MKGGDTVGSTRMDMGLETQLDHSNRRAALKALHILDFTKAWIPWQRFPFFRKCPEIISFSHCRSVDP